MICLGEKNNQMYKHIMKDNRLGSSPVKKDLEALVDLNLNVKHQRCDQKANVVMGHTDGSTVTKMQENIIPLEYFKKDVEKLSFPKMSCKDDKRFGMFF